MAGLLTRFFGRTASEGAAFALGTAASPALGPAVQALANEAWQHYPDRPLAAATLAEGVASGQVDRAWAETEAGNTGVNGDRFGRLVRIFDTGPGVAEAFSLWRRGSIDEAGFRRALKREGLEQEWVDALTDEKNVLLSPEQVALGIVRSLLDDPGFLPVDLATGGGTVPSYPVSGIDPVDEAGKSGTTRERLRVMVGEIGLPMSAQQAASALFRGIIRRPDYNRAILEGDTRPEWADPILEQAREIATASDYVTAHLKGWIDEAAMYAGTARHGMSEADTRLMFLRSGRPAAPGQMATAIARGVDGPDGSPMDEAQFLKGIRQSDIRPEWGGMLYGIRHTYPPLFQLTRLVTAGIIDADTAAKWATYDRYAPEVVTALHRAWTQPTAAPDDTHTGKAQVQLWTRTHNSYLAGEVDEATARGKLTQAGVTAAAVPQVLALWDHERELVRKQLTPAQIKKAYAKPVQNPATGQPWTLADATAALVARGYSLADAQTFLAE